MEQTLLKAKNLEKFEYTYEYAYVHVKCGLSK
jgi:hypothetical protein